MTNYKPDNWIVLKIPTALEASGFIYKVLGGWLGAFDHGSWRLNSGITRVEEDNQYYYFYGHSGSCYQCNKESYGLRNTAYHIYEQIKDKVILMDENTNWMELKNERTN